MSKYRRIQTGRMIKVEGDFYITVALYNYLVTLYEALESGAVWVPEPRKMAAPTIRRAVNEAWVFPSRRFDTNALEYKILPAGIETLDMINRRRHRLKICKDCGSEALYKGYLCKACYQRIYAGRRKKSRQRNADKPCRTCGTAPRHVTRGGTTIECCTDCMREQLRKYQERRRSKACPICGAPVHQTANTVSSYCREHRNRYAARWMRVSKFRKLKAIRRLK